MPLLQGCSCRKFRTRKVSQRRPMYDKCSAVDRMKLARERSRRTVFFHVLLTSVLSSFRSQGQRGVVCTRASAEKPIRRLLAAFEAPLWGRASRRILLILILGATRISDRRWGVLERTSRGLFRSVQFSLSFSEPQTPHSAWPLRN